MLRSSLIDVLKLFSKEDLNDFGSFISSSYLNKNTITVKLFKEVRKYAPDFNDKKLEKEKLWGKIYPGKKYNYGIMKNLIFGLKKLGEDYLSFTNWRKSSFYDKALISELMNRNAGDLFLKKATDFSNTLEKKPVRDQMYYVEKLFVQPMIDIYNLNSIMFNKSRKEMDDLVVKSFLMHYILNCFHLAVEMQKTNNKHDLGFLQYVLEYFKGNDDFFANSPVLKIYYSLMLSLLDITDDKYFRKGREMFNEIYSLLPKKEAKNIYNVLILLCLLKAAKGKTEYSRTQLDLNIEVANKRIFSHREDDSIELEAYRNIVKLAANANEYKILKDFINSNKDKVTSRSPETIVLYSDATLRFAESKFEECLEICSKINFKDFWEINNVNFFFKCDVKLLTLKSHYELNHFESVISSIDSYKHFLNNASEINELNKTGLRLFLNYMSNLVVIKMNDDTLQLNKLKMQAAGAEKVAAKTWLTEKIEELEKSLPD